MKERLYVPPLSEQQRIALDRLYRKTEMTGVRTRAEAEVVRESSVTVLRWLSRYVAEGIQGLMDVLRSGRRLVVAEEFRKRLLEVVRRRPRSLGLEYSVRTLQRLGDFLAEEMGIRVSDETIRRELAKEDIVFSRPQRTISSLDPEYSSKKTIEETQDGLKAGDAFYYADEFAEMLS
jgi:transposase